MSVVADLRYAIRALGRAPGFSAAVILTLALGIGANVTMFGIVDRLMLSPPPLVRDPDRVAHVAITFGTTAGDQYTVTTTSYPAFTDMRTHSSAFAEMAATSVGPVVLGTGAEARSINAGKVSGNFFTLLGAPSFAGRYFGDAEDGEPAGSPVAVLGNAFWRREYGGDIGAIGRVITLGDVQYTIIGVAPPGFQGDQLEPVDLWIPLHAAMAAQGAWQSIRHMNIVEVVARLHDGAPAERVAAEATLGFRGGAAFEHDADSTARIDLRSIVPGRSSATLSTQSRIALWLAAMSAIVFIVAIANVTNLVLVRTVQRRRELAVRLALGAGRWRVVQQLMVESALLALAGGALAVLLAAWGSEAVRTVLLPRMSAADSFVPPHTIALAIAATAIAVLTTGLVPAIRASRPSLVGDLKEGAGATGQSRRRLLAGLLVVQSALSVLLLAGSGLFLTSLYRARHQDLGFSANHVILAAMHFNESVDGASRDARYHEAEAAVRQLPGVVQTSLVQATPFEGGFNVPPISVPGRDDFPLPNQQIPALAVATPTYFSVLGMHLLAGRNFTAADGAGSQLVVVINEAMANGLWPGKPAIGKCIRIGFGDMPPSGPVAPPSAPCREIVGVVNTARRRSIREETAAQARMQYYVPFGQLPKPPSFIHDQPEVWGLLIRTTGATDLAATIRRRMQSFAPNLPYTEVRSLQGLLDLQIEPWTLGATMFTVFGALVALLAAIGLYSVRAYSVAQRQREMGVRIALGAHGSDIVRMVLLEGIRVFGAGIILGLIVTLAGGRLIEPLLFNSSARDPLVLGATTIVLIAIAIVANAAPAVRAARTPLGRALSAD